MFLKLKELDKQAVILQSWGKKNGQNQVYFCTTLTFGGGRLLPRWNSKVYREGRVLASLELSQLPCKYNEQDEI